MTHNYETSQRKIILDFLEASGGKHFTVDDVFSALRAKGFSVARATIYRYLGKLAETGALRKFIPPEGGGACYEYVGEDCTAHYHLRCHTCGELLHFECADVSKLYRHISADHGFEVDPARTVFLGICGKCGESKESGEKK